MKIVLYVVALGALGVAAILLVGRGFSSNNFDKGQTEFEVGNYQAAIELWMPLAKNGHEAAQVGLATIFRCGDNATKDPAAAFEWYELAAAQGNAAAQRWLSTYLLDGWRFGIRRDKPRAVQLLQEAAEKGNADAQYILSRWFHSDLYGVERDDKVSMMWLMRAAHQDHPEAQFQLALSHVRGDGVERDLDQAVHWVRRSADNGYVTAVVALAGYYRHGYGSLPVNYKEAVTLYQKAIEMGSCYEVNNARHALGTMFALGEGVTEDHEQACRLFEISAEGEHHEAMFDVGVCYEEGKGGPRDLIKAYSWYSNVIVLAEANLDWFRSSGEDGEYLANSHTDRVILDRSLERFDALKQVLTPAELTKAEKLAEEWQVSIEEEFEQKRKGRMEFMDSC